MAAVGGGRSLTRPALACPWPEWLRGSGRSQVPASGRSRRSWRDWASNRRSPDHSSPSSSREPSRDTREVNRARTGPGGGGPPSPCRKCTVSSTVGVMTSSHTRPRAAGHQASANRHSARASTGRDSRSSNQPPASTSPPPPVNGGGPNTGRNRRGEFDEHRPQDGCAPTPPSGDPGPSHAGSTRAPWRPGPLRWTAVTLSKPPRAVLTVSPSPMRAPPGCLVTSPSHVSKSLTSASDLAVAGPLLPAIGRIGQVRMRQTTTRKRERRQGKGSQ